MKKAVAPPSAHRSWRPLAAPRGLFLSPLSSFSLSLLSLSPPFIAPKGSGQAASLSISLVKMGRAPCCDKAAVKRGPWSPDEDAVLRSYLEKNGTGGNWISLPKKAGLKRCGKSCRLRWLNYLRPDIKHGGFTEEEDNIILTLYNNIGSRWSVIASHLGGRTDNDVKNYFNTKLKKKVMAANTAATFSALTYMQSTCNPPAPYPPPPFGIKSEADCSGGSGSFPLPAPVEGAHDSDFGYLQDPHLLFWELFGQLPPAGLFDEERCSGGYYAAPEDRSSVASSSATNMENSSSGSYGNWGVRGAAIVADDWFFPELGFGLPEALGGYQSHEKVGAEVAAETKPQEFCHGGRYS